MELTEEEIFLQDTSLHCKECAINEKHGLGACDRCAPFVKKISDGIKDFDRALKKMLEDF